MKKMGRKPKQKNCCIDCGRYALKFKENDFIDCKANKDNPLIFKQTQRMKI